MDAPESGFDAREREGNELIVRHLRRVRAKAADFPLDEQLCDGRRRLGETMLGALEERAESLLQRLSEFLLQNMQSNVLNDAL